MREAHYAELETIINALLCQYPSDNDGQRFDEGKLDPVDPELVGSVDISGWNVPESSCIGIAQRILFGDHREFLRPDRPKLHYISSARQHLRHFKELVDVGLAEKKARSIPEFGFAKFFTILKKVDDDGVALLRTILDCVTANESFVTPPPVNISNLVTMLEKFKYVEKMRALDLRHWYHALKIGKNLSRWFTIAIGSLRVEWKCLPMGWCWACFISQSSTSYLVAPEQAVTWTELPRYITIGNVVIFIIYDNVIAGGPAAELDEFWRGLLTRIAAANGTVKEDFEAVAGTSLDALGLRWFPGLGGLQWELLPKFIAKALEAIKVENGEWCKAKTIAGCLGLVAWGRYACRQPLFDLQSEYKTLADYVTPFSWNTQVPTSQFKTTFDALRRISAAGRQSFVVCHEEVLAFSDAHIGGYGYVGGSPLSPFSGYWAIGANYQSKDMFFLEAIAAKQAVFALARPGRHIFLAVDNKALFFAINKRSTACPRTARVLGELFSCLEERHCLLTVGWLPSEANPADELSRHLPFSRVKLLDAGAKIQWTVPPVPEFGSKLGRVVGPHARRGMAGRV